MDQGVYILPFLWYTERLYHNFSCYFLVRCACWELCRRSNPPSWVESITGETSLSWGTWAIATTGMVPNLPQLLQVPENYPKKLRIQTSCLNMTLKGQFQKKSFDWKHQVNAAGDFWLNCCRYEAMGDSLIYNGNDWEYRRIHLSHLSDHQLDALPEAVTALLVWFVVVDCLLHVNSFHCTRVFQRLICYY